MAKVAHRFVTEEEFLALPESTDKVELIDGEVLVSPSPTYWHQEILRRLVKALGSWADQQKRPVTVVQAPMDVRFGRNRILQPDAFVLFREVPRDHKGPIDDVPELCIEVLSSNWGQDRHTKRLLYAAAGVKELWIVNPGGQVERWMPPDLTTVKVADEVLASRLLPRFRLDLRRLFASRRGRSAE